MARTRSNATAVDIDTLLTRYLTKNPRDRHGNFPHAELRHAKAGPELLALDEQARVEVVARIVARLNAMPDVGLPDEGQSHLRALLLLALRGMMRRALPLPEAVVTSLMQWVGEQQERYEFYPIPLLGISAAVQRLAAEGPLSEPLREAVVQVVGRLRKFPSEPTCRTAAEELRNVIDGLEPALQLEPGEAWSDATSAELAAMDPAQRRAWLELLLSCQLAGSGRLTAKWAKAVRPLIEAVGRDDFRTRVCRWFALVDRPPAVRIERESVWEPDWDNYICPPHVDLLKGLAWCAGLEADRELARALTVLALSAFRKIHEKGARLPALGNAAVAALGMMPGTEPIAQLALVKAKAKSIPTQQLIARALAAAAEREQLPLEDLDELTVPTFGLDESGRRREVLGEHVAELLVRGSDVALRWSRLADAQPLKSVPAVLKKTRAADVKALQAAAVDARKMLTLQRQRIDGLFLARPRWPFDAWRARYLDHPLVGTIARRLIWCFSTVDNDSAGIWHDGRLVDANGRPLDAVGPDTTVTLWHPIDRPADEAAAWRDWLERHQVTQPFAQAHREIYRLTDAERATRLYSNRFAAHYLRQHQYHALCTARGWQDRLRLLVGATYPPTTRALPAWGLHAEFGVTGVGDQPGRDTNETGTFLYLSTDQVRFHATGADAPVPRGGRAQAPEPVPLDRVPPLVLSEILRDVDLFVSVASVGNDPTWHDGGPEGRYAEYWTEFALGDATVRMQNRKAVLERLVPRLKIAPRCRFEKNFLVVRGDLRTYKIHLGSGNILMSPNNQYLCIVPDEDSGDPAEEDLVFLPFDGDDTLSIIVSKALLLAEDAAITDPTIVSQIGARYEDA